MNATNLLRYGLLLFLLQVVHRTQGLRCHHSDCSKEESCTFSNKDSKSSKECSFVIALDKNCSFKGAMAGSSETTKEYLKELSNTSQTNLSFIAYTSAKSVTSPAYIVSDNVKQSGKWTLANASSTSGCNYEKDKMLCTLLAGPGAIGVNKTMCPDPTTTTRVSTTTEVTTSKGRTVYTRGHLHVLKATESTFNMTTSGTLEFTTSEDSDVGIPIWAYAVGVVLFLLVIGGCVLGYFAWKRKWFQKKAKPAPQKKAEGKVVLRPHNEFPDLMPDSVWKQKGPLRMLKNQKGPLVHKLDGVKSEPLKGPIQFDYDNMEVYDIGEGVEILTGESSTLSMGPLPKSDTVHGGPPDVSVAGTTDVSVATQKSKKKAQLPVEDTQKELKSDKKPEETNPDNPKKSKQLKVEQTQEE